MSELKGRTIRLSEENWAWLDSQPGTMNEVITSLRSVLRQPHGSAQDTRIDEILELVRSLPDRDAIREIFEETAPSGPAPSLGTIAGVQIGAANLPKNAYCKHCGNKFAGNKYAQVCVECEELGHKRVPPAECPECQAGAAL